MSDTTIQTYHGTYLMPSLAHATVADAMHPGIVACPRDSSLTDVARLMASHHVHCVVVWGADYQHPGESLVWGIVSDLDLVGTGIRSGPEGTAATLARQPVISVEPSMALREAGELMITHGVSHLVVVEPAARRPVGVLSTLDVAGVLAWGEAETATT